MSTKLVVLIVSHMIDCITSSLVIITPCHIGPSCHPHPSTL